MNPAGRPDVTPYDALLVLSFGGPEKPEDVVPFLENVTRGRGIPRERLEQVGEHYFLFGGRSPINDQNRALIAAIEKDFADQGIDLPVYFGNRNWDPYLADTLAHDEGRRGHPGRGLHHVGVLLVVVVPAVPREPLRRRRARSPGAPRLDKLRQYYNHPGFIEPAVDAVPRRARPSCPTAATAHDWSSSPTRSRPRWPRAAARTTRPASRVRRTSASTAAPPTRSPPG